MKAKQTTTGKGRVQRPRPAGDFTNFERALGKEVARAAANNLELMRKTLPDIFPKATGPGVTPFRDPQQAIQWLRLVEAVGQVSLLTRYRGAVTHWIATDYPTSGWGCVPFEVSK